MNEYEELHRWLDEQAEDDTSTEELLQEYGLTMEEASEQADLYREKFFELLRKYEVCSDNISVMIAELDRLIYKNQNEDLLFVYTALATEKGLLFGNMEDEEQKILCWLKQSGHAEKFSKAVRMEKIYQIQKNRCYCIRWLYSMIFCIKAEKVISFLKISANLSGKSMQVRS